MDPDWIRWILMSLSKHFTDILTVENSIGLILQNSEQSQDQTEGAEFSTNGPFFYNPSTKCWILDVDVNVLLNVFMDDQDIYKMARFQSNVLKAYTKMIPVFKYEATTTDINIAPLLGCLNIFNGRGEDILVFNYGQVAPDIRMGQSLISATYRIELVEGN